MAEEDVRVNGAYMYTVQYSTAHSPFFGYTQFEKSPDTARLKTLLFVEDLGGSHCVRSTGRKGYCHVTTG